MHLFKFILVIVIVFVAATSASQSTYNDVHERFNNEYQKLTILHREIERAVKTSLVDLVDAPDKEEYNAFWGIDVPYYGDALAIRMTLHELFWQMYHALQGIEVDEIELQSWEILFSTSMDVLRSELDSHAALLLEFCDQAEKADIPRKLTRLVRLYAREIQRECVGVLCY